MILNNSNVVDQTEAINRVPLQPSLMRAFPWFRDRTVRTDSVTFDVKDNSLILPTDKLRTTADKNTSHIDGYTQHTVKLPYFPVEGQVSREQLAGIRAFDSEGQMTIASAVAEHIEDQSMQLDMAHEYAMAEMLLNGVYNTVYHGSYNMFTEFGLTQSTYALGTGTDALADHRSLGKLAKDGLNVSRATGYVWLVGDEMFDYLLSNAEIKEVFRAYQATAAGNPYQAELQYVNDNYQMFKLGNTTIINYSDSFTDVNGNVSQPLASDEGRFIPRTELGQMFFGPQNTLAGLSGAGARKFSRQVTDPQGRFIRVESESSSLPILRNPGAVVKVTMPAA